LAKTTNEHLKDARQVLKIKEPSIGFEPTNAVNAEKLN
jgi:hypothetical protein